MTVKVLFVCLGNICRSPTAHGVFVTLVERQALADHIVVDSAGTGDWHLGHPPDQRAAAAALQRGYDLAHLRARKVTQDDFGEFDYILAMDNNNLSDLQLLQPGSYQGQLQLFLEYHPEPQYREVPDPYYGGDEGFNHVLDLVERASQQLLEHLVRQYKLR